MNNFVGYGTHFSVVVMFEFNSRKFMLYCVASTACNIHTYKLIQLIIIIYVHLDKIISILPTIYSNYIQAVHTK